MTVAPPHVWLLLVNAAATFFMVGVIWFVQIVHYPLFSRVGEAAFSEYERHHARRTSWVVAMPMLLELATSLATVWVIGGALAWCGLSLLAVAWVSTGLWQVPAHRRLEGGFDAVTHRWLLKSNWVRTVAWSARGIIAFALLSAVMLFSPLSARADPDPLSAYRWKHRLLVVDVPDTESGRATLRTFRASLDDRMQDVLARDLLIVPVGDLPRPGDALRPAVDLGAPERLHVRRRLGLQDRGTQLVLIGKDGGMKARQSEAIFDLERIFELIDSMPMRRAEMQQDRRQ